MNTDIITKSVSDWQKLGRDVLMQMAQTNPKFFLDGQFINGSKVQALGNVLTDAEIIAGCPQRINERDRRYNAALGMLKASRLWPQEREAEPITVNLNSLLDEGEIAAAACFAVVENYMRRAS